MRPCRPTVRRQTPWLPAGFALLAGLLVLGGCAEYPRDPEHTTDRVESGVMRVGVIHDPPFVRLRGPGEPRGPEVALAQALAQSLDARVVWVLGGQDELLEDLEHFRLDLVVGGLSPQSPWQQRIALVRPFKTRGEHGLVPRVAAVPPGENRWQLRVERFTRGEVGRAILESDDGRMRNKRDPTTTDEPAR